MPGIGPAAVRRCEWYRPAGIKVTAAGLAAPPSARAELQPRRRLNTSRAGSRLGEHGVFQMRNKESYRNRREQRSVSLRRLGVKSSAEQQCVRRSRRRAALCSLLDVAGREGRRRWQMAGESGGREQLPNSRPPDHLHHGTTAAAGRRGGEEQGVEDLGESVKIQAGPAQCKDPRGKENAAGNLNPAAGKRKMDDPALSRAAEQTDRSVFFDEDSNHIFPVEQFFGNLDTVQDFSQRTSSSTEGVSRREYRRRHYYAKDESDEEQT